MKNNLKKFFGPKKEEVIRGWEELHNEELSNVPSSPNIVGIIKSNIVRWAEHVARMRWPRNSYELR
jgi:hypothetical protein